MLPLLARILSSETTISAERTWLSLLARILTSETIVYQYRIGFQGRGIPPPSALNVYAFSQGLEMLCCRMYITLVPSLFGKPKPTC